jgi:serine/threonine protein kinase
MVMDFCGGDLWGFLSKTPSMSEWQAAKILSGVLSALEHVHSRGMVHRDVKVENILMVSNERPVLADFGLACMKTDREEMRRKCGSPGYVAPEVLDADCLDYDEKVDIFAAGVVFYFMLCRRTPFHGSDLATILRRTVRCKLSFEGSNEKVLSVHCKRFIRWLLSKNPEDRPHAGQVLESNSFQYMCMPRKLAPREVTDADSKSSTRVSIDNNFSLSEASAQSDFDPISMTSDLSVRPHPPPSRSKGSKRFARRAWSGSSSERSDPASASMADDILVDTTIQGRAASKPPSRDQASFRRFRSTTSPRPSSHSGRDSTGSGRVSTGSSSSPPQALDSPQRSGFDLLAVLCEEPSAAVDGRPSADSVNSSKLGPQKPRFNRLWQFRVASPRRKKVLQANEGDVECPTVHRHLGALRSF